MSATRIKKLEQEFRISSFSWNGNILTINTLSDHMLYNGVQVIVKDVNFTLNGVVTVINATSFSVPVEYRQGSFYGYTIDGFLPGQVGFPEPGKYSIARGHSTAYIIQSYTEGTGGANFSIDLSLDGNHWISNVASISHNTVNNDSGYIVISPGWTFFRANLSSVGANTTLKIITGS